MKMELPEIRPEERTPLVEALLGIIRQLLDRVHELEVTVQELGAEIATLKGQKPRPDIKLSVLETPLGTEGPKKQRRDPAKRPKTSELHMDREVPLQPDNLAEGATVDAAAEVKSSVERLQEKKILAGPVSTPS